MSGYHQIISEATGITNPHALAEVESYMRDIYFHSTLDWQSRETLVKAARESAEEVSILKNER